MRIFGRHRFTTLSALVVVWTALMVPLGSPGAAAQVIAPYDHSKDKGKPGTHGPLPEGFSRTQLSVKFRADRAVRLREGAAIARAGADTAAIQAVLAKYPGVTISRTSPQSEQAADAERIRLEAPGVGG